MRPIKAPPNLLGDASVREYWEKNPPLPQIPSVPQDLIEEPVLTFYDGESRPPSIAAGGGCERRCISLIESSAPKDWKLDMDAFDPRELRRLHVPLAKSNGEDNGQVTIIGGSSLFHGAPLLALKTASRIVDMVFFSSPETSLKSVVDKLKASLSSFIWVPWNGVTRYIEKSDAVLIGPGFLRFRNEKVPHGERHHICDEACQITKSITEKLLKEFPNKKWVIDAGSLQTMDPAWIPENAILTPNVKEFEMLFKIKDQKLNIKMTDENVKIVQEKAKEYKCVVVYKAPETIVSDGVRTVIVTNGNAGLTKGGTGDTQAGLTVALLAKNEPFLTACSASYTVKAAADELYKKVGVNYNADDLADKIPEVLIEYSKVV